MPLVSTSPSQDSNELTDEQGRHLEIDRAKGLGIILVVWGHLASVIAISSPLWFLISVSVVYSFHMPLFMYLSGFVYFASGQHLRFFQKPLRFLYKRADRLLVPFLSFGVLIVLGKYIFGRFAPIPDPVQFPITGIISVITNAAGNPSASIWYLLVLFCYSILTPLFWRLCNKSIYILLVFGAALQFPSIPEAFYLDRIFTYFLFFVFGGLVALNKDTLLEVFRKFFPAFSIFFVAICASFYDHEFGLLICGVLSAPAIHGLFLQPVFSNEHFFLNVGKNSMVIYLLNTIVLGVCGVLLLILGPSQDYAFLPFGFLIFLAGTLVPIAFKVALERMGAPSIMTRYLQ